MKEDIRNLTLDELRKKIISLKVPKHRALQIFKWLNKKDAVSFDVMTDLPKSFIEELKDNFVIGALECQERLISRDTTEKFLWQLSDSKYIETVLIKDKKRKTLCLSTQVGCKYKCTFCASGVDGFIRNLSVSEIVDQILATRRICGVRATNIVFMGMGEPLDNYENLVKAIHIINDEEGIEIGARKITVSTCGIVPGILKLKDMGIQVELSISLHGVNNKIRNELVPANQKYPLDKLIAACKEYNEKTKRQITIEYVLIRDKNDSETDAKKLAEIAKTIRAKINLIIYNPYKEFDLKAPKQEIIDSFAQNVRSAGVKLTVRKSKGADISGACGQLAAEKK